jgi:hypothetical protein
MKLHCKSTLSSAHNEAQHRHALLPPIISRLAFAQAIQPHRFHQVMSATTFWDAMRRRKSCHVLFGNDQRRDSIPRHVLAVPHWIITYVAGMYSMQLQIVQVNAPVPTKSGYSEYGNRYTTLALSRLADRRCWRKRGKMANSSRICSTLKVPLFSERSYACIIHQVCEPSFSSHSQESRLPRRLLKLLHKQRIENGLRNWTKQATASRLPV